MARCSSCNQFVSYGEPEIFVTGEDVDAAGTVTAEVHVGLTCGNCGQEIKTADFQWEESFDHQCPEEDDSDATDAGYDIGEVESSPSDRSEGTGRSAKTFYGADLATTVTCRRCGEEIVVIGSVEEQAAAYEEV